MDGWETSALIRSLPVGFGAEWCNEVLIAAVESRFWSRARIAGAEADDRAVLARFDGVVLSALRETETALTDYSHDLDRHAALVAVNTQAQAAVAQARSLYVAGRAGSLSLLDAQRTAAAAARDVAASDAQLSADQVALFLALGGGWESTAVQPGS
ncbi:MAG TPA: TolC family protein [Caulobacteraceae bacterium]|nr:TolC family protein [Caulobacteraceae bacterium]